MKTVEQIAHGVLGAPCSPFKAEGEHFTRCELAQAAARAALTEAVGKLRAEAAKDMRNGHAMTSNHLRRAADYLVRSFGLDASEKGGG